MEKKKKRITFNRQLWERRVYDIEHYSDENGRIWAGLFITEDQFGRYYACISRHVSIHDSESREMPLEEFENKYTFIK